jgi:hypothetical protein
VLLRHRAPRAWLRLPHPAVSAGSAIVGACGIPRPFTRVRGNMNRALLVALIVLAGCRENDPAPAAPKKSSPDAAAIEVAWELRPVSKDPDRPKTAVAVTVTGTRAGRMDAGELFGQCHPLDASAWTGADKPITALVCGYAGNFRNVGVFKVGDTLVLRVHEIEEGNHPEAKEPMLTVGAPWPLPANATVTAARAP